MVPREVSLQTHCYMHTVEGVALCWGRLSKVDTCVAWLRKSADNRSITLFEGKWTI
jgi:hypothetical protein